MGASLTSIKIVPLKILNLEPDFSSIKYLGFKITPTGDWTEFLNSLIQKEGRALSENFDALSNQYIPFQTRIRIGKAAVLSKSQYGADIIPLNDRARTKLTSFHMKMLRIVFGVPRATESRALLMIAGETPFCEKRMLYSEMNRERFRKLRHRTFPLLAEQCPEFKCKSATQRLFQESSQGVFRARKYSSIKSQELNKRYAKYRLRPDPKHQELLRDTIRQVLAEKAHCESIRLLMNGSNSCALLPHCFSRPQFSPLLKATGYQFSHYVQWLTNSIQIRDEFILRNKTYCPLCQEDFQTDSREHLLTACTQTEELRELFLQSLLTDNPAKAAEFLSLAPERSWLWILAAGCYPAPPPRQMYQGHRSPRASIFRTGRCYEIDKKTDTPVDVISSFQVYQEIIRDIPRSAYHIYTDGSRDTTTLDSGAAAVVRHHNNTIGSRTEYTGKETANYAELHAVLLGLRWICEFLSDSPRQVFHFWIDSRYAFRLLTEQDTARRHFFIVQDIFQLASHLSHSFSHSFTLHRISSHVERFSRNACRIEGSIEADRQAQEASKHIAPFKSIDRARLQILDQSARLLQQISGLVYKNTAGPSDSSEDSLEESDDFSATAIAQDSMRSPALHPDRVSASS